MMAILAKFKRSGGDAAKEWLTRNYLVNWEEGHGAKEEWKRILKVKVTI